MDDEKYMNLALQEAKKGLLVDEVPIGAIIVYQNKVIASAFNQKETLQDATAHAEILAIQQASKILGRWHLDDCILYTTSEPCIMCSGAIIQSRISRVVYGAKSQRWDGLSTYLKTHQFNHYPEIVSGILEKSCMMIVSEYFKNKRKNRER